MKKKEAIAHWVDQAKRDVQTASDLFATGHYDWCLFMWHLAIEKSLKAKMIAQDKPPLYIHDLTRLAKETDIPLCSESISHLNEISAYNIEARYDNIKFAFYKKATKEYTTKWVSICKDIYTQINKNI